MFLQTINPANGDVIREYEIFSDEQVLNTVNSSFTAFQLWKEMTFSERAKFLKRVADVLRNKASYFAEIMAKEMGKPFLQGVAESEKCAWVCDYYAENSEKHLEDLHIKTEMNKSFVTFQPIGPILAIMPWNFPFWQVFRFAAPALMAGNSVVLKHSPNTFGCAIEIEKIFQIAGLPQGVFTNLIVDISQVPQIIANPKIAGVTFTGSTKAGAEVGALAGKYIKKSVLELGGSDPYIIMDDANLEKAADSCIVARLLNTGQSCIAGKRFIVTKNNLEKFEKILLEKAQLKKVGDPMDKENYVGPIARKDLQLNLHRQVVESIEKGAEVMLGCELKDAPGFFYPVSILTNVKPGMPAFDEELFGPVFAIIPVDSEEEAIEYANNTNYGLGAAIFSNNIEKSVNLAKTSINSGTCYVNDFVRSDPRLPFGGTRQSGYGRELSSFGIEEFVNVKTICVI